MKRLFGAPAGLVAITGLVLTAASGGAFNVDLSDERSFCRKFGSPGPGSVIYPIGPSNRGVPCIAHRDSKRYSVQGYRSRDKAQRGARVICRWYSAGVVVKGKYVVVSPERGFHRMGWLAGRLNGAVACNG